MQAEPRRGLSLVEAMVLVAAIAPGLALTRGLPGYLGTSEKLVFYRSIIAQPGGGQSTSGWGLATPMSKFSALGRPIDRRASYWLCHTPYWASPCLACLSLASAGLALRRPGRRPIVADLGSATGPAVAVALAAVALRVVQFRAAHPRLALVSLQMSEASICYLWSRLPRVAGFTLAVWWLALALCGRRAETGVANWPGRALGWCWIAAAVSSEVGVWLFALNC